MFFKGKIKAFVFWKESVILSQKFPKTLQIYLPYFERNCRRRSGLSKKEVKGPKYVIAGIISTFEPHIAVNSS